MTKSGRNADETQSARPQKSNLLMGSKVNTNSAMEQEADRISAEVGAKYDRLDDIKSALGSRLGVDFSKVQFHTDSAADHAAKSLNAKAFTKGNDVYLGSEGMDSAVAAHELVHTVQQGAVAGGNTMSAPSQQVQLWKFGKSSPNKSKPLSMKGMNFGKSAYRNDEDYQNISKLMKEYNNNQSPEAKAQLMEAAMNYIDKNSRGEKAKHVGRTKNAEDLLIKLSMDNGQKKNAINNLERFKGKNRDAIRIAEGDHASGEKNIQEGYKVLDTLQNAVNGKGFSNATSMITANVMADQDKSDYFVNSRSGCKRTFNSEDPNDYRYTVGGRADVFMVNNAPKNNKPGKANNPGKTNKPGKMSNYNHMDNVGTHLHEFTHASVGESFKNTRALYSADKDASDEELLKRRDDRAARFAELMDSSKNLSLKTNHGKYDYDLVNMRNLYGMGNKMDSYVSPMVEHINEELPNIKDARNAQALTNERDQLARVNNVFNQEKREKGANGASSSLVEYDSVINQMLIQYEMATKDRSSQHYRQLKAAALRAHVDRAKGKLKNQAQ